MVTAGVTRRAKDYSNYQDLNMDPADAAAIMAEASDRARRRLQPDHRVSFTVWGLLWFLGYGIWWLAVRGQHPLPGVPGRGGGRARGAADMSDDELNPVIHTPARLRIMVTLATLRDGHDLSFTGA
jgi:hypothetical protein